MIFQVVKSRSFRNFRSWPAIERAFLRPEHRTCIRYLPCKSPALAISANRCALLTESRRVANLETVYSQTMSRHVEQLAVWRATHGGRHSRALTYPRFERSADLTLAPEYGVAILSSFEKIEGRRYSQGLYIRFGESLCVGESGRVEKSSTTTKTSTGR